MVESRQLTSIECTARGHDANLNTEKYSEASKDSVGTVKNGMEADEGND